MIPIYTDGSCKGNGRKDSKCSIGVWFGKNDERNLSKRIFGDKLTNIVAELEAIKHAILIVNQDCIIYSDCLFAINVLNGVITSKTNRKLIGEIQSLMGKKNHKIYFEFVYGHCGDEGNENAHELCELAYVQEN